MSSPFGIVFGLNHLIFPRKQVPCKFSLNLPLLGLGPSTGGVGTNLKLSNDKIAWIHSCLDLGPSSKVALSAKTCADFSCFLVSWGEKNRKKWFVSKNGMPTLWRKDYTKVPSNYTEFLYFCTIVYKSDTIMCSTINNSSSLWLSYL
jgi:hypothetical protein